MRRGGPSARRRGGCRRARRRRCRPASTAPRPPAGTQAYAHDRRPIFFFGGNTQGQGRRCAAQLQSPRHRRPPRLGLCTCLRGHKQHASRQWHANTSKHLHAIFPFCLIFVSWRIHILPYVNENDMVKLFMHFKNVACQFHNFAFSF